MDELYGSCPENWPCAHFRFRTVSVAELEDRLDVSTGDKAAKRSAFWVMLVLSGMIAGTGVVGDSTATVIGRYRPGSALVSARSESEFVGIE